MKKSMNIIYFVEKGFWYVVFNNLLFYVNEAEN